MSLVWPAQQQMSVLQTNSVKVKYFLQALAILKKLFSNNAQGHEVFLDGFHRNKVESKN